MEIVRTIKEKDPMGVRLTKEAINANLDAVGLEEALKMESFEFFKALIKKL